MAEQLLTAVATGPLAQTMGGGDGTGWGIVMMIAMLLLVVLVVVGVIWLVRLLLSERDGRKRDEDGPREALRVLDRRLAEGEIAIEEYRERRSFLERGR